VGSGGTDVSGLTRGFATLLPRWIQEPLPFSGQSQGWKTPKGAADITLLCVHSGSALLGDLGVSTKQVCGM